MSETTSSFDNLQQPKCPACHHFLMLKPVRKVGYVYCCLCNHPEALPSRNNWIQIGIDMPDPKVDGDHRISTWDQNRTRKMIKPRVL